jgi:hypothetical protein
MAKHISEIRGNRSDPWTEGSGGLCLVEAVFRYGLGYERIRTGRTIRSGFFPSLPPFAALRTMDRARERLCVLSLVVLPS